MIFTVRTTVGQESLVADIVAHKAKKEKLEIYSITIIPGLKGYILLEADSELTARHAIQDVPHVKGKGLVSSGTISMEELTPLLESKPLMSSLKEGLIVEIIAGPFKGEKARITRVNPTKEEVTVELLEAVVKIPVTISAEHVVIKKE